MRSAIYRTIERLGRLLPAFRFSLLVRGRQLRQVRGSTPGPFLHDCRRLVEESDIRNALVMGFGRNGRIRLVALGVEPEDTQKFRNILHLYL